MTLRRQLPLSAEDVDVLDSHGLPWESILDGSAWVLIYDFPIPSGYNHATATVAIRVETGYPSSALDMVYFYPFLMRTDGKPIKATEHIQNIDGKSFQRWSRHRTSLNPWRAGHDNLGTHIILVEDWLDREFER